MPRKYVQKKTGEVRSYKNITVDPDIIDIINRKAKELEHVFGFKPTISQTLRFILKKVAD